jgi:hypothetical protein
MSDLVTQLHNDVNTVVGAIVEPSVGKAERDWVDGRISTASFFRQIRRDIALEYHTGEGDWQLHPTLAGD